MLQAVRDFAASAQPLRSQRASCEAAAAAASAAAPDADSIPFSSLPAEFTLYQVLGFRECPWFHRAACIASDLATSSAEREQQVEVSILPVQRDRFGAQLQALAEAVPAAANHHSCPAIVSTRCMRALHEPQSPQEDAFVCDEPNFVGGYSQLETLLQQKYKFKSTKCEIFQRAMNVNGGGCEVPAQLQAKQ